MIPVLAGILAAAALFLMSMPFVLVRFAPEASAQLQLDSEQHPAIGELTREAQAEAETAQSVLVGGEH